MEAYPNNATFEKMLESNPRQNQYVVCAKCLKKIEQSNVIQCASYNNTYPKNKLLLYKHDADSMPPGVDGDMLTSTNNGENTCAKHVKPARLQMSNVFAVIEVCLNIYLNSILLQTMISHALLWLHF